MFEIAKEARIRPDEFSKLAKVTRTTASLWYNGHTKPHHLIQARIDELLAAIKAGIEAGDFPVPHGTHRRERFYYTVKTLEKHLGRPLSLEGGA